MILEDCGQISNYFPAVSNLETLLPDHLSHFHNGAVFLTFRHFLLLLLIWDFTIELKELFLLLLELVLQSLVFLVQLFVQ